MARQACPPGKKRREEMRLRRAGKAIEKESKPLLERIVVLMRSMSEDVGKWLTLDLAILTVAMLVLWRGARSGNGWLTLCALSRAMPLETNEKMRSKRLYRLLSNDRLDGTVLTPLLVRLALGPKPSGWIALIVDQTTVRGTPTIMVGVRLAGRVLPVAFATYVYEKLRKSQNIMESSLLKLVAASLPLGCKPLFVMDRGYARVDLLRELRQLRIPYLIRGRGKTLVYKDGSPLALGRLRRRKYEAIRYRGLPYQSRRKEPVDVVVYHDPGFKEAWYLLLPADSEGILSTSEAVNLYRERMYIELTFRDWKTHLGIRGLRLEQDVAARLGRLLLALSVAYHVAVLLGVSEEAAVVRADCEVLRSRPRHGTRRRLSALTVGILALSLERFRPLARRALSKLLTALCGGAGGIELAVVLP